MYDPRLGRDENRHWRKMFQHCPDYRPMSTRPPAYYLNSNYHTGGGSYNRSSFSQPYYSAEPSWVNGNPITNAYSGHGNDSFRRNNPESNLFYGASFQPQQKSFSSSPSPLLPTPSFGCSNFRNDSSPRNADHWSTTNSSSRSSSSSWRNFSGSEKNSSRGHRFTDESNYCMDYVEQTNHFIRNNKRVITSREEREYSHNTIKYNERHLKKMVKKVIKKHVREEIGSRNCKETSLLVKHDRSKRPSRTDDTHSNIKDIEKLRRENCSHYSKNGCKENTMINESDRTGKESTHINPSTLVNINEDNVCHENNNNIEKAAIVKKDTNLCHDKEISILVQKQGVSSTNENKEKIEKKPEGVVNESTITSHSDQKIQEHNEDLNNTRKSHEEIHWAIDKESVDINEKKKDEQSVTVKDTKESQEATKRKINEQLEDTSNTTNEMKKDAQIVRGHSDKRVEKQNDIDESVKESHEKIQRVINQQFEDTLSYKIKVDDLTVKKGSITEDVPVVHDTNYDSTNKIFSSEIKNKNKIDAIKDWSDCIVDITESDDATETVCKLNTNKNRVNYDSEIEIVFMKSVTYPNNSTSSTQGVQSHTDLNKLDNSISFTNSSNKDEGSHDTATKTNKIEMEMEDCLIEDCVAVLDRQDMVSENVKKPEHTYNCQEKRDISNPCELSKNSCTVYENNETELLNEKEKVNDTALKELPFKSITVNISDHLPLISITEETGAKKSDDTVYENTNNFLEKSMMSCSDDVELANISECDLQELKDQEADSNDGKNEMHRDRKEWTRKVKSMSSNESENCENTIKLGVNSLSTESESEVIKSANPFMTECKGSQEFRTPSKDHAESAGQCSPENENINIKHNIENSSDENNKGKIKIELFDKTKKHKRKYRHRTVIEGNSFYQSEKSFCNLTKDHSTDKELGIDEFRREYFGSRYFTSSRPRCRKYDFYGRHCSTNQESPNFKKKTVFSNPVESNTQVKITINNNNPYKGDRRRFEATPHRRTCYEGQNNRTLSESCSHKNTQRVDGMPVEKSKNKNHRYPKSCRKDVPTHCRHHNKSDIQTYLHKKYPACHQCCNNSCRKITRHNNLADCMAITNCPSGSDENNCSECSDCQCCLELLHHQNYHHHHPLKNNPVSIKEKTQHNSEQKAIENSSSESKETKSSSFPQYEPKSLEKILLAAVKKLIPSIKKKYTLNRTTKVHRRGGSIIRKSKAQKRRKASKYQKSDCSSIKNNIYHEDLDEDKAEKCVDEPKICDNSVQHDFECLKSKIVEDEQKKKSEMIFRPSIPNQIPLSNVYEDKCKQNETEIERLKTEIVKSSQIVCNKSSIIEKIDKEQGSNTFVTSGFKKIIKNSATDGSEDKKIAENSKMLKISIDLSSIESDVFCLLKRTEKDAVSHSEKQTSTSNVNLSQNRYSKNKLKRNQEIVTSDGPEKKKKLHSSFSSTRKKIPRTADLIKDLEFLKRKSTLPEGSDFSKKQSDLAMAYKQKYKIKNDILDAKFNESFKKNRLSLHTNVNVDDCNTQKRNVPMNDCVVAEYHAPLKSILKRRSSEESREIPMISTIPRRHSTCADWKSQQLSHSNGDLHENDVSCSFNSTDKVKDPQQALCSSQSDVNSFENKEYLSKKEVKHVTFRADVISEPHHSSKVLDSNCVKTDIHNSPQEVFKSDQSTNLSTVHISSKDVSVTKSTFFNKIHGKDEIITKKCKWGPRKFVKLGENPEIPMLSTITASKLTKGKRRMSRISSTPTNILPSTDNSNMSKSNLTLEQYLQQKQFHSPTFPEINAETAINSEKSDSSVMMSEESNNPNKKLSGYSSIQDFILKQSDGQNSPVLSQHAKNLSNNQIIERSIVTQTATNGPAKREKQTNNCKKLESSLPDLTKKLKKLTHQTPNDACIITNKNEVNNDHEYRTKILYENSPSSVLYKKSAKTINRIPNNTCTSDKKKNTNNEHELKTNNLYENSKMTKNSSGVSKKPTKMTNQSFSNSCTRIKNEKINNYHESRTNDTHENSKMTIPSSQVSKKQTKTINQSPNNTSTSIKMKANNGHEFRTIKSLKTSKMIPSQKSNKLTKADENSNNNFTSNIKENINNDHVSRSNNLSKNSRATSSELSKILKKVTIQTPNNACTSNKKEKTNNKRESIMNNSIHLSKMSKTLIITNQSTSHIKEGSTNNDHIPSDSHPQKQNKIQTQITDTSSTHLPEQNCRTHLFSKIESTVSKNTMSALIRVPIETKSHIEGKILSNEINLQESNSKVFTNSGCSEPRKLQADLGHIKEITPRKLVPIIVSKSFNMQSKEFTDESKMLVDTCEYGSSQKEASKHTLSPVSATLLKQDTRPITNINVTNKLQPKVEKCTTNTLDHNILPKEEPNDLAETLGNVGTENNNQSGTFPESLKTASKSLPEHQPKTIVVKQFKTNKKIKNLPPSLEEKSMVEKAVLSEVQLDYEKQRQEELADCPMLTSILNSPGILAKPSISLRILTPGEIDQKFTKANDSSTSNDSHTNPVNVPNEISDASTNIDKIISQVSLSSHTDVYHVPTDPSINNSYSENAIVGDSCLNMPVFNQSSNSCSYLNSCPPENIFDNTISKASSNTNLIPSKPKSNKTIPQKPQKKTKSPGASYTKKHGRFSTCDPITWNQWDQQKSTTSEKANFLKSYEHYLTEWNNHMNSVNHNQNVQPISQMSQFHIKNPQFENNQRVAPIPLVQRHPTHSQYSQNLYSVKNRNNETNMWLPSQNFSSHQAATIELLERNKNANFGTLQQTCQIPASVICCGHYGTKTDDINGRNSYPQMKPTHQGAQNNDQMSTSVNIANLSYPNRSMAVPHNSSLLTDNNDSLQFEVSYTENINTGKSHTDFEVRPSYSLSHQDINAERLHNNISAFKISQSTQNVNTVYQNNYEEPITQITPLYQNSGVNNVYQNTNFEIGQNNRNLPTSQMNPIEMFQYNSQVMQSSKRQKFDSAKVSSSYNPSLNDSTHRKSISSEEPTLPNIPTTYLPNLTNVQTSSLSLSQNNSYQCYENMQNNSYMSVTQNISPSYQILNTQTIANNVPTKGSPHVQNILTPSLLSQFTPIFTPSLYEDTPSKLPPQYSKTSLAVTSSGYQGQLNTEKRATTKLTPVKIGPTPISSDAQSRQDPSSSLLQNPKNFTETNTSMPHARRSLGKEAWVLQYLKSKKQTAESTGQLVSDSSLKSTQKTALSSPTSSPLETVGATISSTDSNISISQHKNSSTSASKVIRYSTVEELINSCVIENRPVCTSEPCQAVNNSSIEELENYVDDSINRKRKSVQEIIEQGSDVNIVHEKIRKVTLKEGRCSKNSSSGLGVPLKDPLPTVKNPRDKTSNGEKLAIANTPHVSKSSHIDVNNRGTAAADEKLTISGSLSAPARYVKNKTDENDHTIHNEEATKSNSKQNLSSNHTISESQRIAHAYHCRVILSPLRMNGNQKTKNKEHKTNQLTMQTKNSYSLKSTKSSDNKCRNSNVIGKTIIRDDTSKDIHSNKTNAVDGRILNTTDRRNSIDIITDTLTDQDEKSQHTKDNNLDCGENFLGSLNSLNHSIINASSSSLNSSENRSENKTVPPPFTSPADPSEPIIAPSHITCPANRSDSSTVPPCLTSPANCSDSITVPPCLTSPANRSDSNTVPPSLASPSQLTYESRVSKALAPSKTNANQNKFYNMFNPCFLLMSELRQCANLRERDDNTLNDALFSIARVVNEMFVLKMEQNWDFDSPCFKKIVKRHAKASKVSLILILSFHQEDVYRVLHESIENSGDFVIEDFSDVKRTLLELMWSARNLDLESSQQAKLAELMTRYKKLGITNK